MNITRFSVLALGIILVMPGDVPAEDIPTELVVQNVSIESGVDSPVSIVSIQTSFPLEHRIFDTDSPPKIYMQFVSSQVVCMSEEPITANYGPVINAVCKSGGKTGASFVSLFLRKKADYKVTTDGNTTKIEVFAVLEEVDLTAPAKPQPPFSLEYCTNLALAHYKPIEVAERQFDLARLRRWEAKRSLLPTLTGIASQTDGKLEPTLTAANKANYQRQEIGVEFGQPIFQGRKLLNTYRQSKVQLNIAGQNLIKARIDVIYDTVQAYNNVLKAQQTVEYWKEMRAKAEERLNYTERKLKAGVVTDEEILKIRYIQEDVKLQDEAGKNDLSLARSRLRTIMQVDALPENLPGALEHEPVEVNLEELLGLAAKFRPDYNSAKFSVQFYKYGYLAAKAGRSVKIDATAFYGSSGGAFEGERLVRSPSWNVGMKASYALLGNALSSNYSSEKTSPDLGESSRTRTISKAVSLSLLDPQAYRSEEKQAEVYYMDALSNMDQAKRNMELEVIDAYSAYVKAKLKYVSSMKEINFREKDTQIAREKEKLDIFEGPQVIEAELQLTRARGEFAQAIADCNISLAAIERAIGTKIERQKLDTRK